MRFSLYAGVAIVALAIPNAASAQSTGSTEVEEEIVVTGSARRDVQGIRVPEGTKARQVLTNELINRLAPGQTVLQSLNLIPGVNFTNNDPFGSSGGNVRIRGFDGNRISLTFDGIPLNDTGNYAIFSNQQLDPELIDEVNVNLGTTDVDSPTASAAGGTINYRTITPGERLSATGSASFGDFDFTRVFGLIETGEFTSFGTRAFISASTATNDKFKGPGRIYKQQYNIGIYQPLGGSGDFVRLSGHYNQNRNSFYRNPNIGDLRTLLGGASVIPTARPAEGAATIPTDISEAQRDAVFGFENNAFCSKPTPGAGRQDEGSSAATCTNFFGVRTNPSNTGNVRLNSRFTLTDNLTLFVDGSYQYVLANGGGYTTLEENSLRARGSSTAEGVDYNGDNDFLDRVGFYTPNNTNTRRWTLISSLLWEFSEGQRLRVAYTYDRGRHRQTGEWGFLDAAGFPESPFGGRNSRPVLTADGFQFQQRDRLSIALLNQLSAEYVGRFLDDALTVQAGIRAPFFERELDQRCLTEARGNGFAYCTSEPIPASQIIAPGGLVPSTGPTPYYAPFEQNYKFDAVLPNLGINYRFTNLLSMFASYAKGFSAPRTDNLYRAPIVTIDPEKTDSFDLGLRVSSSRIQAQLTGWYIRYNNRIVTSFDQDQGISIDRNVGAVDSYGVDASISIQPVSWLSLTANASYLKSELKQDIPLGNDAAGNPVFAPTAGKQVVETPEWQFGGRAQVSYGPVEIGFQGKWVDDRFATDVNDVKVPSYALFDLDARLNLADLGMEKTYFQVNVQNIFDEFYFGSIGTQINAYGVCGAGQTGGACNTTSSPNFTVGYPRTFTGSLHFQF